MSQMQCDSESSVDEKEVKTQVKKLLKKKMADAGLKLEFTEDILPPKNEDENDG